MSLNYWSPICGFRRAENIVMIKSNLQTAEEQLSQKNLQMKDKFDTGLNFNICLYLRNIFRQRFNNSSLHSSRKLSRQYCVDDMGDC